jgi:hypothetical protein
MTDPIHAEFFWILVVTHHMSYIHIKAEATPRSALKLRHVT